MRRTGGSRSRCARCCDERGSGIVEFALIALLLFTLSAGAFDYGQAWRTGLAVNEAARTGARVGSAGGEERASDFNALSGLKASLASSGKLDDVVRVVVFNATTADGDVPAVCKTTYNSRCQVITGNNFRSSWEVQSVSAATSGKGCLNVATYRNWCPTDRETDQADAEYYGVWIQLRHDYLFPIMGDGVTIERTAVMRLEPKVD